MADSFNDYNVMTASQLETAFENNFSAYEQPTFTGGATGDVAVEGATPYIGGTYSDPNVMGTSSQPLVAGITTNEKTGFASVLAGVDATAQSIAKIFTSIQNVGLAKDQAFLNKEVNQGNLQIARDKNAANVSIAKSQSEAEISKAQALANAAKMGTTGGIAVAAANNPWFLYIALAGLGFTAYRSIKK